MSFCPLEWVSSRSSPCLDRLIKAEDLREPVVWGLGSSQSAFLITGPCSLLPASQRPVNMAVTYSTYVKGLCNSALLPRAGNVSFRIVNIWSLWHSEEKNVPGLWDVVTVQ